MKVNRKRICGISLKKLGENPQLRTYGSNNFGIWIADFGFRDERGLDLNTKRLQRVFADLIQYVKALFTKMTVKPENVFQTVMSHGDKTNTIDKAQFFSAQTEPEFKSQAVPCLINP